MTQLADYADRYRNVRLERRDGVLQVTLHTDGDSLRWGMEVHAELPDVFSNIARDRENRVVILTGTGAEFSGPAAKPGTTMFAKRPSMEFMDNIHWEGRYMLQNLLSIEVPVISVVNGPAWRHSELPLLGDIVLASDTAAFQDSAHFVSELVPGDGIYAVYAALLGFNRARYFLMTGQILDARQAHELGLVAELMPADRLLARAWELAEDLARRPTLLLRYTRLVFVEPLRKRLQEVGYSLAMESLAIMDKPL
jgi:enoyl-CoA hydratase/carnithine racemase